MINFFYATNKDYKDSFTATTISGGGDTFDPTITKSSGQVRWELGDGTTLTTNTPNHSYGDGSEKTFTLKADNFQKITAVEFDTDKIIGSIDMSSFLGCESS